MTDRIHSVTLVLDRNIRIDDAESLLTACRQLRGVVSVTPNISDLLEHVAHERARRDMTNVILDALHKLEKS